MKRYTVIAGVVLIVIIILAVIVRIFFTPGASPRQTSTNGGEQARTVVVPSPQTVPGSDKWDATHYAGLLTVPYGTVNNPYASQTLFRGTTDQWESADTVLVDIASDTVRITIPESIHVLCYPTNDAQGTPMREQSIGLLPQLRNIGVMTTRDKVKALFPKGTENMLVAADVTADGKNTAYLVMHIGCKDPNYPVKIP